MKGFQSVCISVNPWFRNSEDAYHDSLEQFMEFIEFVGFMGFVGPVGLLLGLVGLLCC